MSCQESNPTGLLYLLWAQALHLLFPRTGTALRRHLKAPLAPHTPRPACLFHLTRVLCLASASSFRLAEGAARCALLPAALLRFRIACRLAHRHHSLCPGFDKAVEECKYRAFVAASNHITIPTTPLDARPVADRVPARVHRHVALRRHAEHARHAAADAALHGARPRAECVATPLNAHAPPTTHGISRMRPLL